MKIKIIEIDSKFRPSVIVSYPVHHDDFGVEQDFFEYLQNNQDLLTESYDNADWLYLPVYWTRWYVQHDYGRTGKKELQSYIDQLNLKNKKLFTICQYDDGPLINVPNLTVFASSRKNDNFIDIPLLSKKHKKPLLNPRKKYLASFVGRLETHPIRSQMEDKLKDRNDIKIINTSANEKLFVDTLMRSYVALCPRGYGGSSFRFYESMQLGVVPFLIGNEDTRPFKKYINWDSCSLFSGKVSDIGIKLEHFNSSELRLMGIKAKHIYKSMLDYRVWPILVIKELENLWTIILVI